MNTLEYRAKAADLKLGAASIAKLDGLTTKYKTITGELDQIVEQLQKDGADADRTLLAKADHKKSELKKLDDVAAGIVEAQELLDSIKSMPETDERGRPVGAKATSGADRSFLDRSPASARQKAAEVRAAFGTKALIGAGTQSIPTPLLDKPVLLPGQAAFTLSQLLPRKAVTSPVFQYLKQTQRENNAAVVPVGTLKPTSKYGFDTVKGELATVAHLSEPFAEQWAEDFPEAVEALIAELLTGIWDADENLILNGDGEDDNPTGILTQAFVTDMLTTTRTAITSLEVLGHRAGAFVLHPTDWQAIELARNTSGQLEYSSGPIDRAAMRLWGVPVATSTRITAGTGLALDLDAAYVLTKGEMNVLATNAVADDVMYNRLRIRAEHRFGLAVTKPTGIVSMTLTAGEPDPEA